MITDICVNILKDNIRDMDIGQEFLVRMEIDEALLENRFVWVMYEEKPVGFLIWKETDKGILFGNCCILREFRHKDSLMGIRKHFKGKRLFWRNRRRQREVSYGIVKNRNEC